LARIVVREAGLGDAPEVARVHVETSRAAYEGLLPDELRSAFTFERRRATWSETLRGGAEFVYVAEDGGRVVGFASGGPERGGDVEYDGELYTVYVLPARQRLGAGRLLTLAVAERLASEGFRAMLLWVLEENEGARRFYETLGGAPVRAKREERGGRAFGEVAYGWPDLSVLCERIRAGLRSGRARTSSDERL
jgi:ribosomal protein S18 acetylase RimI-like enzyme